MPSDYQLIDGFERLRDACQRVNPGVGAEPAAPEADEPAALRVALAWLRALAPARDAAPPERRRLRRLARILTGEADDEVHEAEPRDERLLARRAAWRAGLDRAQRRRLWPLADDAPDRSLAEEAAAWAEALPGLTGVRPWRFLRGLGRPVIEPEMPLRRFLWRLGLLERADGDDAHLRRAHGELERIVQLTGLPAEVLRRLLRWHTGGERELTGGRVCGARPRCAGCPFGELCPFARYKAAPAPDADGAAEALAEAGRRLREGRAAELGEADLLALTLAAGGMPRRAATRAAAELLRQYGNLRTLSQATPPQLAESPGLTPARCALLLAALELGRRLGALALQPGSPITCSEEVWQAYRLRYRDLAQEHFVVLLLDAKNRVIHEHVVSKGTLTGSHAHPREVFQQAVRRSAAAMILLHNHPSGDPTPSPEDRAVTARLRQAGEILGIRVLDHIILGAEQYYSFRDRED